MSSRRLSTIWQAVTDEVSRVLPTFRVSRSYDAVQALSEITQPTAIVTLDGRYWEELTQAAWSEKLEFLIWLSAPQDSTEDMDEYLDLVDAVMRRFSQDFLVTDCGKLVFSGIVESESHQLYDQMDMTANGLFSIVLSFPAEIAVMKR